MTVGSVDDLNIIDTHNRNIFDHRERIDRPDHRRIGAAAFFGDADGRARISQRLFAERKDMNFDTRLARQARRIDREIGILRSGTFAAADR